MKTLAMHIQESFAPFKEVQQTVVENLNDNHEELVNDDELVEKAKPSE